MRGRRVALDSDDEEAEQLPSKVEEEEVEEEEGDEEEGDEGEEEEQEAEEEEEAAEVGQGGDSDSDSDSDAAPEAVSIGTTKSSAVQALREKSKTRQR
jgi:hypothetical protein